MIKRIVSLVVVLLTLQGMAQSPPNWIYNLPSPSNDTYLYVRGSGEGQTEREARKWAYLEVLRQTASNIGIQFDSEKIFSALWNGEDFNTISSTYDIPVRQVCDYPVEKATCYKVFILCQVARSGKIRPFFDDFNECYKGPYEPLYVDGFSVYQNGRELSDAKLRTMFVESGSYKYYDAALRYMDASNSNAGLLGLGIAGGVLTVLVGLPVMATSNYTIDGINSERDKRQFYTGVGIMATGGVLLLAGMCWKPMMRMIGKVNIRKAVNHYNNSRMYSQNRLELKYGLTEDGVFLSFSF